MQHEIDVMIGWEKKGGFLFVWMRCEGCVTDRVTGTKNSSIAAGRTTPARKQHASFIPGSCSQCRRCARPSRHNWMLSRYYRVWKGAVRCQSHTCMLYDTTTGTSQLFPHSAGTRGSCCSCRSCCCVWHAFAVASPAEHVLARLTLLQRWQQLVAPEPPCSRVKGISTSAEAATCCMAPRPYPQCVHGAVGAVACCGCGASIALPASAESNRLPQV